MKYKYTQSELERIAKSEWLTVRERKVFELYFRDGIRIEDIAAEIDVNRSTIDRILKRLRGEINDK